jgi:hypothetical protein
MKHLSLRALTWPAIYRGIGLAIVVTIILIDYSRKHYRDFNGYSIAL